MSVLSYLITLLCSGHLRLIMGSTSAFPTIKEVRTFLIDGVGSGGDYHNVSCAIDQSIGAIAKRLASPGERRPLVNRQRHFHPYGPMGSISRLEDFLGNQCLGLILR